MTSRTRIRSFVRRHEHKRLAEALLGAPTLLDYRDDQGRNWLHLCCAVDVHRTKLRPGGGIQTAQVLIGAGLGVNVPAFVEDEWKATPLWYAIAFGRNTALARFLLEQGSDPDHCVWAAVNQDSAEALRLLWEFNAPDPTGQGTSPLIAAVDWNRPAAAQALLELGVDVNHQDETGRSALLVALQRKRDVAWVELLLSHGATTDLPDHTGETAAAILRRKRSPRFAHLRE